MDTLVLMRFSVFSVVLSLKLTILYACMYSSFPSPIALGTIWKDDFAVGVVVKLRGSLKSFIN